MRKAQKAGARKEKRRRLRKEGGRVQGGPLDPNRTAAERGIDTATWARGRKGGAGEKLTGGATGRWVRSERGKHGRDLWPLDRRSTVQINVLDSKVGSRGRTGTGD